MKKDIIILAMIISIFSTLALNISVKADSNDGWQNLGTPQYTKGSGTRNQWGDTWNSEGIMNRIRNSYSYKNRMPNIQSRSWVQTTLYPNTANPYGDYTNITYCNSPYGPGYTSWYDSVYGLFLDYESGILRGNPDGDSAPPTSVTQDSIDFNNVQFGNVDTAYIATDSYDNQLGDAKEASKAMRDNTNMSYPIYLNNGSTIEGNVQSALSSKGVKNVIVLGGSSIFPPTIGMNNNFNIIRVGGANRERTGDYLKSLPNQMLNPNANHWNGDSNGIVMINVPSAYQGTIYSYLQQQATRTNDVSSMINAVNYLTKYVNMGTSPYNTQSPSVVIGVHNNIMETYWVCYFSTTGGWYTYQYILPNYFQRNASLQLLDNNRNPVSSVNLIKGQSFSGYIRATNLGNVTWSESEQYRLGTDGTNPFSGTRFYLPYNIAPNSYYDFPVTYNGTSTGSWNLRYQMLQEGVTWFGQELYVPVNVTGKPNLTVQSSVVSLNDDSVQSNLLQGNEYRLKMVVTNNGIIDALPNQLTAWTYNWNCIYEQNIPFLPRGQSTTVYAPFTASSSGMMTYYSCIDHSGIIDESNEDDNWGNGTVNVLPINTKPTAAFTISPNPQLSGQSLNITDNSTTNDSWDSWNSVNPKMWNWRSSTDDGATWSNWLSSDTTTKPSSFNATVKTLYEIKLTVKDTGNALSGPLTDSTTRQVTILPINTKPTANFTVTPSQYIDYPLTYADYSSANDYWDSLVAYEWSYSSDSGKTWSASAAAPPTSFGTPGTYKIRLRVKDQGNSLSPGQWSDYCIKDVEMKDLTILGQVLHTDRWNSNRIKYNQSITQTDDSPRSYDMFFQGEKFILKAKTTTVATKVTVQIEGTDFNTTLTSKDSINWDGELWDESMFEWKDRNLNFIFTAYYSNNLTKTYTVPVKIVYEQYWVGHRLF